MRIIVVEDDLVLRKGLTSALRGHGHSVHGAATGQAGLDAARALRYDVVLLDLGLPDIDGIRLLPQLREHHRGPVIVLSARRDQSDKVSALDAGADDYMTKPFGLQELLARLRAVARRAGIASRLSAGEITISLGDGVVTGSGGRQVPLTATEWAVLEVLARAGGSPVSTDRILVAVWGDQGYSNYVRVYINNLRRKLETGPAARPVILTQPGRGYRLAVTAGAEPEIG